MAGSKYIVHDIHTSMQRYCYISSTVAVLQLTEIEWLLCEVILALLVVLRPLVSTE